MTVLLLLADNLDYNYRLNTHAVYLESMTNPLKVLRESMFATLLSFYVSAGTEAGTEPETGPL